jgi:hypothetical protein
MAFKLIDRFAERLKQAGIPIGPIDRPPWIDTFELKLGQRRRTDISRG